jgi:hypothetical protein
MPQDTVPCKSSQLRGINPKDLHACTLWTIQPMPQCHARGRWPRYHCNADRLNTDSCLCTSTPSMRRDNKATSEIIKPPVPLSSPTAWRIKRYNGSHQRPHADGSARGREGLVNARTLSARGRALYVSRLAAWVCYAAHRPQALSPTRYVEEAASYIGCLIR